MEILDADIYARAKDIVYKQYKKASAYRSGALVKKYKEMGGRYAQKKGGGKLKRWFDEHWGDIGGKGYPVFRPSVRVSKDTPLLKNEIDPKDLREKIKLKQKIRGNKNLPPFVAK